LITGKQDLQVICVEEPAFASGVKVPDHLLGIIIIRILNSIIFHQVQDVFGAEVAFLLPVQPLKGCIRLKGGSLA